jgi:hypothetical protein
VVTPIGVSHGEAYTYDTFGNMQSRGSLTIQVDPATNRLSPAMGASYDVAGNLTQYGGKSYSIDPFNMAVQVQSHTVNDVYIYTAPVDDLLANRGEFLAEREVMVLGDPDARLAGDQPRCAEMVEMKVTDAAELLRLFRCHQLPLPVDVVFHPEPGRAHRIGTLILALHLPFEVADGPAPLPLVLVPDADALIRRADEVHRSRA